MLMDEAVRRIPALAETGIRKFYNGPESFTPDNQFLLGRGARAARLLRRRRLQLGRASRPRAAPAGRWPSGSSRASRPATWSRSTYAGSRRSPATTRGCASGSSEILGLHYAVPWPNREPETGARRPAVAAARRGSAAKGAVFGTKMGWERPNVFGADARARLLVGQAVVAGRVGGRAGACRDRGRGLRPDLVLQVRRRRARTRSAALQWVCAADVDVPVGHCVYTPLLNARGTYEADLTVTRTGPDSF